MIILIIVISIIDYLYLIVDEMISLGPLLYLGKLNQAKILPEPMNEMDGSGLQTQARPGIEPESGGVWSDVLPLDQGSPGVLANQYESSI